LKHFPVILYGSDYWAGLIDWLRGRLAAEGKISPSDLELLTLTDSIQEIVRIVTEARRLSDLEEDHVDRAKVS
jgi:predicted Rossmann-fold nucleotide-binding protein